MFLEQNVKSISLPATNDICASQRITEKCARILFVICIFQNKEYMSTVIKALKTQQVARTQCTQKTQLNTKKIKSET